MWIKRASLLSFGKNRQTDTPQIFFAVTKNVKFPFQKFFCGTKKKKFFSSSARKFKKCKFHRNPQFRYFFFFSSSTPVSSFRAGLFSICFWGEEDSRSREKRGMVEKGGGGGVRREDWKMAPHHWEKIFFWSEGGVATELTRKRKCILRGGWAHAQALTSKQTRPHARTHTHTHTLSSKSSLSLSHKHTHYCKKITVLHTPSPVAYSNTRTPTHQCLHTHTHTHPHTHTHTHIHTH